MDPTLPLHPLHPLLPLDEPFTPTTARAVGLDRGELQRLLERGHVRRLLRGVYVASAAPDCVAVRAAAVALALRGRGTAVDRTAGWVHGLTTDLWADPSIAPDSLVPLDAVSSGGRASLGGRRHLVARETQRLGELSLTTPLRTALDLGRLLPADQALGALDGLLATGSFTQVQLVAELPRFGGLRGIGRLRSLAAQVDDRARGPAESVLRRRWLAAALPTPVTGLVVAAGHRPVRLALGVPRCQFGATLAGRVPVPDLVALEGAGWRIVVLPEQRVRRTDPDAVVHHLEREFHQHLLMQVRDEERVG